MKAKIVPILEAGLIILVILETVVLVGLAYSRFGVRFSHRVPPGLRPKVYCPLFDALEYEAPDMKFEQLVKDFPYLVNERPSDTSRSILSTCAELRRTNFVRILIANGANVSQAIDEERTAANDGAVQLLQQVQSEVKR